MKYIICFLLMVACVFPTFSAAPKNSPQFIMVHIGPKHQAFDEALYPDLKIVYLPDFAVTAEIDKKNYSGSKATWSGGSGVFQEWFEKAGFQAFPRFKGLLYDKNGVCVFEGWLNPSGKAATDEKFKFQNSTANFGDQKALKGFLDDYVARGKTIKENAKAGFASYNTSQKKYLIGSKLPAGIEVFDSAGTGKDLAAFIAETAPVMVVFFSVPPAAANEEVSIAAQRESTQEATTNAPTASSFFGAMVKNALADNGTYTAVLDQIEQDFFGYLVNKAR